MGDVPVGAVPSPVASATAAPPASPTAVKAAKLASVTAGLAKLAESEKVSAPVEATPTPVVSPDAPTPPPVATSEAPAADEAPDPKTAKGLAAIEKQAKRFRDEQSAAKAELDVERAEIARLRAEATGKVTSIAELKKMKPLEVLEALGFESEDDYDVLARGAYAKTKAGKTDPRLKQQAEQTAEARDLKTTVAELRKQIEELGGEFTKRDARAQTEAFVAKWQDEAIKAIPEEPSLIGRLAAKSPEKARDVLLTIGKYLEKQTGETPTHAECIEEYEKYRRAELEDTGVDVAALLRPQADAPAKKSPSRSLDITTPGGTRPLNTNLSRAEKLAAVTAGLRKLDAETA